MLYFSHALSFSDFGCCRICVCTLDVVCGGKKDIRRAREALYLAKGNKCGISIRKCIRNSNLVVRRKIPLLARGVARE